MFSFTSPARAAVLLLLAARNAGTLRALDFDEAKHPRGEHGQWSSGTSGSSHERIRRALERLPPESRLVIGGHVTQPSAQGLQQVTTAGLLRDVPLEQQAQVTAALAEEVKKKASKKPLLIFSLAAATDWTETSIGLAHGASENNPTINWLKTPPKMVAAGVAQDVVGAWVWTKVTKDHSRIQAAGFYIAAAVRGTMVIRNIMRTDFSKPKLVLTWQEGFDESKHPRDEKGQWTSGPGGAHSETHNRQSLDALFERGLNLERSSLPQIPGVHHQEFLDELKHQGISINNEDVAPTSLLPTQSRVGMKAIGEMAAVRAEGRQLRPILISKDNYVLDGHHRWATEVVRGASSMPVMRIMVDHVKALDIMRQFAEAHNIASRHLAEFDETKHRRDEHGRWTTDATTSVVMTDQKVLAQPSSAYTPINAHGRDTREQFVDQHGKYTAERRALHQAIVDEHLKNTTPVKSPIATVLGGGPASGKSTMITQEHLNPPNTVHIDVDHIRTQLPEYRERVGKDPEISSFVHEESSDIMREVLAKSIATSRNVTLDGTGDGSIENLAGKIGAMRAGGHEIVGHYATTDVDTALARMHARGEKTGRYVPETYLRQTHAAVSRTFPEALKRGLFDRTELYDTTTRHIVHIASARGTSLIVHDRDAWDRFIKKGEA